MSRALRFDPFRFYSHWEELSRTALRALGDLHCIDELPIAVRQEYIRNAVIAAPSISERSHSSWATRSDGEDRTIDIDTPQVWGVAPLRQQISFVS